MLSHGEQQWKQAFAEERLLDYAAGLCCLVRAAHLQEGSWLWPEDMGWFPSVLFGA